MKEKFLSGLFVIMGLFMASTFCACSNDDDDSAVSGEDQVLEIMNAVDNQIDNMLVLENEEDTYYIESAQLEDAKSMAKTLTALTWDGKSTSIKLNNDYGTIKINQSNNETVYYSIVFSFRKTSFSDACDVNIKLVNEAYFSSDNADTRPAKPRRKSVFPKGDDNTNDDDYDDGSSNDDNGASQN
jgi:hypothetical protein